MSVFSDLAQTRIEDVERPKPIPAGHYQALVTGPAKEHKAKTGNTALRFPFKLVAPGDDVDAEELDAAGGLPDKEYTMDFWMSPDARWRFTEFVKAIGGPAEGTLMEAAEWLAGSQQPFLIQAKQEQGGDDNTPDDQRPIFTRFDNPAAIAD
jgi:hypothetical protein